MIDKSPELSAKLGRAYATERLIPFCNLEVSTTPLRGSLRLVIGTAMPREADDLAGGTAAMRKGSEVRTKTREKYISSGTLRQLVGAH